MRRRPKKKRSGSEKRERGTANIFPRHEGNAPRIEIDAAAHGLTFGSYLRWLLFDKPADPPRRAAPVAEEVLLRAIERRGGQG